MAGPWPGHGSDPSHFTSSSPASTPRAPALRPLLPWPLHSPPVPSGSPVSSAALPHQNAITCCQGCPKSLLVHCFQTIIPLICQVFFSPSIVLKSDSGPLPALKHSVAAGVLMDWADASWVARETLTTESSSLSSLPVYLWALLSGLLGAQP